MERERERDIAPASVDAVVDRDVPGALEGDCDVQEPPPRSLLFCDVDTYIYIYIYIYVYIYIYTYREREIDYVYIYIYIHAYIHTYTIRRRAGASAVITALTCHHLYEEFTRLIISLCILI